MVGSVLCCRNPIPGVRALGAISGLVIDLLCDLGQITSHLWASVPPSVKSLRIIECQGWEGS